MGLMVLSVFIHPPEMNHWANIGCPYGTESSVELVPFGLGGILLMMVIRSEFNPKP